MRRGDWKMIIKENNVQIHNLKNDPQERTDVSDSHIDIAKSMKGAIERFKTDVIPGS